MTLNKQLLNKLMYLSRLSLPEPAALAMLNDLSKICTWLEKLDELETKTVQPLMTMSLEHNIMRDDIPQESLDIQIGLADTTHKGSNYFSVPQVKD